MSRPRLTSLDLWANHEKRCLGLLRSALALLGHDTAALPEVDLNRRLYKAIVRASHSAGSSDEGQVPVVVPEGRNPPASDDEERARREFKVPDFYWAFIDHLASDPDTAAKQFVVECKRVTKASKTWVYTREYIASGVLRFINLEHSYAKGMSSGAMVGYLQQLGLDDALAEVNAHAGSASIPLLDIDLRVGDESAELSHEFARTFPESPFRLAHLWQRV